MIAVQITRNFQDIDLHLAKLEELVKTVCSRFKLSKATVSVVIVDNAQIRKLNSQFLKRKSACDCLSFDLSDEGKPRSPKLFELIVNGEMAAEEANLRGHLAEAELALYVTHALLHNLGFDDSTREKAKKMHDTEDEILQQFGYGLVYNKSR